MQIRRYLDADQHALCDLWQRCGLVSGNKNPEADIRRFNERQAGQILLGEYEDKLMASLVIGYDGHRGWLYYLCVADTFRGKGFARALLNYGEQELAKLGCTKVNLQIREGNEAVANFYRRLGYATEPRISMGKTLAPSAE